MNVEYKYEAHVQHEEVDDVCVCVKDDKTFNDAGVNNASDIADCFTMLAVTCDTWSQKTENKNNSYGAGPLSLDIHKSFANS